MRRELSDVLTLSSIIVRHFNALRTKLKPQNGAVIIIFITMCRLDPSTPVVQEQHEPPKQPLPVYFKWKRLRFGFHGVCASLAFGVTSAALFLAVTESSSSNLSNVLIYISVLLNTTTAYQARQLLDHVPLQTEIIPGVVAPHREAFKRTMSMMHYSNLRILGCILLTAPISSNSHSLYKLFLAWFIYNKFLPRQQFDNGNTWIFVVPMFLGTSLDLLQYAWFAPNGLLSTCHYLLIEWSALVIAFFFTLAFRGYFTIFQIYVVSACAVATLFGGGLYVLLSSIMSGNDV